jgi:hypothetical protein
MKYSIILIFLFFSFLLNGQTAATKWETICKEPDLLVNFRVTCQNSIITLDLKFHLGNHGDFSVSDTNSLWIKLLNGKKIKLKSKTNEVSVPGGGSIHKTGITVPGAYVHYDIPNEYNDTLAKQFIEKIRIFTSRGYTDIKIGDRSGSLILYGFRDMLFELRNSGNKPGSNKDSW